jgi:hypothetical protein
MKEELKSITEKEWEHAGFKCKVVFVRQSHRCGYVTIPKSNIAFGKGYDELPIDVHGGLTFDDIDSTTPNEQTFGFDCAHLGDKTLSYSFEENGHFWTLEETVAETNRMAEQFAKLTLKDLVMHKLEYMPDWFKNSVQFISKTEDEKHE